MEFINRNKVNNHVLTVKEDNRQGRYLVTSTDVPAGTLILEEDPVTQGPKILTAPVCLTCYHPVSCDSPRCPSCNWPFCSSCCMSSPLHASLECLAFQQANIKVDADTFIYEEHEPMYDVINPLRMIMLRQQDPDTWDKFMTLQSHVDDWETNPNYREKEDGGFWDDHSTVADYIKNTLKIDMEKRTIFELFGIFYTNDFTTTMVDSEGLSGTVRMTYLLASMPSHSCQPNARCEFSSLSSGLSVRMLTTRDLVEGDQILITYVDTMDPTPLRQKHLFQSKLFVCGCARCTDPTEGGTMASAIRCKQCKEGFCLPMLDSANYNESSNWRCDFCSEELSGNSAMDILLNAKLEKDALTDVDPEEKVEMCEGFLAKFKKVLHPNNGLLVSIKQFLLTMYGRHPGYTMMELSPGDLMRKKQLGSEVLAFLDLVDPVLSSRRGVAMYELHLPLIMLGQLTMATGGSQKEVDQACEDMKLAVTYLEKSLEIFKYEPEESFEGKIYSEAQASLPFLQDFVDNL